MIGDPHDGADHADACQEQSVQPESSAASVIVAYALAGALGAMWAWRVLRRTYFFQDEWAMIRRGTLLDPIDSATRSFNGHLWLFQDAFYRTQSLVFGLDSNRFIVALFLGALVTLHLTLATFARRLGMALIPSLLVGALLTYLGPAAQNYVFAVQISPTLATAAAIGAAAVALGPLTSLRTGERAVPDARRVAFVALLLLLSVVLDSVIGVLALTVGGGVVVGRWPRSRWWVVAPAGLATVLWFGFADLGSQAPASVGERLSFALELAARSAGAIVGGGPWAGVVVVAAFIVAVAAHVRSGAMIGTDRAVTVAGAVAATLFVGAISQSRAGVEVFSFYQNNRYYQNVAIPMVVAVLPAAVGIVRRASSASVGAAMMSVVIVGSFLFGQGEARRYENEFVERNDLVRSSVENTLSVITTNCPSGQPPKADVEIVGALSPGLRVSLVAEVARRGFLSPATSDAPDAELVARICPP